MSTSNSQTTTDEKVGMLIIKIIDDEPIVKEGTRLEFMDFLRVNIDKPEYYILQSMFRDNDIMTAIREHLVQNPNSKVLIYNSEEQKETIKTFYEENEGY